MLKVKSTISRTQPTVSPALSSWKIKPCYLGGWRRRRFLRCRSARRRIPNQLVLFRHLRASTGQRYVPLHRPIRILPSAVRGHPCAQSAAHQERLSIGSLNLVSFEWFNEDENNESIRFGAITVFLREDENDVSTIESDGWEPVLEDIDTSTVLSDTLTREGFPPDLTATSGTLITDEWGNFNGEIFAGFGGNAFKVAEDTLLLLVS